MVRPKQVKPDQHRDSKELCLSRPLKDLVWLAIMPKYLIDANLPHRFAFWNTPDYEAVPDPAWKDDQVWAYAAAHGLTIITKDVDYEVLVANQASPHVIRLCVGNMRRRELWVFLEKVWPAVLEASAQSGVRLTRVFRTHLETA